MEFSTSVGWIKHTVEIVRGHQVASGNNGDPRFPGGTVRMQVPYFKKLGLDLTGFYPGTMNVSVAPLQYKIVKPRYTFRSLKWHPTERAEDFSFFDLRLLGHGKESLNGFVYFPHPETKPEHFQKSNVLEFLLPHVDGVKVGSTLQVEIPSEQMRLE